MGFDLKMRGRAWIAVVQIENMRSMGLSEEQYSTPEYVADFLTNIWNESGKGRTSAAAVCMSANGLYHVHMALYGNTTTLQNVINILHKSHVEPQLGGKVQLQNYLLKQGKYAEKGEQILFLKDIENVKEVQGQRNDLDVIEELLVKGLSPQEILNTNFRFYKYEKMILHAYTDQRVRDAPIKQDVYVEYHVGESGSGKTYFYNHLCEEYGIDNIYILTDYDNNASGGLDSYMKVGAPPILFMDEFKGFGISYGKLLTMLNGYTRMQTHSRYANSYNLWEKVYITSVYPPERVHKIMVDNEYEKYKSEDSQESKNLESYDQLKRRITKIVYHYIDDGEYKTYSIDGNKYIDYEDLKKRAAAAELAKAGFITIDSSVQMDLPF